MSAARAKSLIGWMITFQLVAVWFVGFRPPALGGDASTVAVKGHSMDPTFHGGDLVVVHRKSTYEIGDIVAFRIPDGELAAGARVIHRIVGGSAAEGYVTQGDNNDYVDKWHPMPDDILGEKWLHLPKVAALLSNLRHPLVLASLAALSGFLVVMTHSPKRRSDEDEAVEPARGTPTVKRVPAKV